MTVPIATSRSVKNLPFKGSVNISSSTCEVPRAGNRYYLSRYNVTHASRTGPAPAPLGRHEKIKCEGEIRARRGAITE